MLRTVLGRLSVLGELVAFLWARRLWWLIPMVMVIALLGLLVVFTQSSAMAPFFYPLF